MKIRKGFVSNSSSTSFCIFGACVKEGWGESLVTLSAEEIEDRLQNTTLRYATGESDEIYVGLNWHDMDDNETKQDFMRRIRKLILDAFPEITDQESLKVYMEVQGWYDG